jgi:uncharacterized protein YrrD
VRLLLTAKQLLGLPVVTVRGGDDIAEVREVIYNPDAGRLVGLTLNGRGFWAGRHPAVLAAEAIHAIGRHAIMVMDESSLTARENAPGDIADPPVERDVIGDDVLTEGGVRIGVVQDLVLLAGPRRDTGEQRGDVIGYQIARVGGGSGFIPLPTQVAVSGTALVVPNITDSFQRDDLVGLGAAMDEFRARLGVG